MNLLRNQLKDYLDLDQDLNFDQIVQIIASELKQKKHQDIPLGNIEMFNILTRKYDPTPKKKMKSISLVSCRETLLTYLKFRRNCEWHS